VINTTSYASTSNRQHCLRTTLAFYFKARSFSSILLLKCCSSNIMCDCLLFACNSIQTNKLHRKQRQIRKELRDLNNPRLVATRIGQGNRNRKKRWERKPNMDNINAVMESCTMQRETNTSISHRRHTKREKLFKSECGRTSKKLIVRYKSHAPYCFGNMQGLNNMNDIHLISIILR
jgi:hypothetical protein